jgi:hypothetical protein
MPLIHKNYLAIRIASVFHADTRNMQRFDTSPMDYIQDITVPEDTELNTFYVILTDGHRYKVTVEDANV